MDVKIKREGVFTDADGFAKVIHYWNFQSVWFCSQSGSSESNLPMKVSAKFSVSTHVQMCVLQSMSRLADQKCSWYLSIMKMTKYLSLVQQNINAISQLKKENEYRSVWTGCIGLVDKSFVFVRSISVDLLSQLWKFIRFSLLWGIMWQHPWVKFGCVF